MQDRNFDDIADHFEAKIYRGTKQKGRLRQDIIWRDLSEVIPDLNTRLRRITDIGAGLGQFVLAFAEQGHNVVYNDISQVMHDKAYAASKRLSLSAQSRIVWHALPYQKLPIVPADLLLCHAVIEWLAEPDVLLPTLAHHVQPDGYLSLCCYNPTGYTFRNLLAGNFNLLDRAEVLPDKGSLTPMNPSPLSNIHCWLNESGFAMVKQSGIRVFSDDALVKRGGLTDDGAVLARELAYSDQPPFNEIGRYTHILAQKR